MLAPVAPKSPQVAKAVTAVRWRSAMLSWDSESWMYIMSLLQVNFWAIYYWSCYHCNINWSFFYHGLLQENFEFMKNESNQSTTTNNNNEWGQLCTPLSNKRGPAKYPARALQLIHCNGNKKVAHCHPLSHRAKLVPRSCCRKNSIPDGGCGNDESHELISGHTLFKSCPTFNTTFLPHTIQIKWFHTHLIQFDINGTNTVSDFFVDELKYCQGSNLHCDAAESLQPACDLSENQSW